MSQTMHIERRDDEAPTPFFIRHKKHLVVLARFHAFPRLVVVTKNINAWVVEVDDDDDSIPEAQPEGLAR